MQKKKNSVGHHMGIQRSSALSLSLSLSLSLGADAGLGFVI